MPFQVSEADLSHDHDELFACQWAAWTQPFQAAWTLTFPILGSGPDAITTSMKAGAARQRQNSTPSDRWVKVVDTDTGKVIAGALWKIYKTNPYRVPWQNLMLLGMAMINLNLLFMLPEYRNQGAGALSVEWGTRLADEMGLGASVEARHMGKGVYERYGFVVMHIVDWRFENAAPNDEWKRMVEELHKYPLAVMWRPEGGKYVKGETVVPWEGSPRE